MSYEVIVVGAGHAGCEAALATAKKGHKTLLITSNINHIADTPCNPSIGGPAKGVVVREIDALGGIMGKITDQTTIQMRMLNKGKGPAVRALRSQIDKKKYPWVMKKVLESQKNLYLREGMVENLIINNHQIFGVELADGTKINSPLVILTTGTYLKADILVGDQRRREGPSGQKASLNLSDNLKKLGFKIMRLKTGTPARLNRYSIDFSQTQKEEGDKEKHTFSHDQKAIYKIKDQEPCYLLHTTPKTHQIIRDNLTKSSMYGGYVTGTGTRYCPSIEDKVVRFADKERHQIFLEPESKYTDDIYIQGFSTSMPPDVQEQMIRSLPGLEKAIINKYGYAIEYDALDPTQLYPSLETKLIQNLFTAGQINGTSGYEEAAAQGLIAGINAALKLENTAPLILGRDEAYIGVLIDDLVTKGTKEPYRLLTSRAEFRLLLRHDNADLRLREYGYQAGLISSEQYNRLLRKKQLIEQTIQQFKQQKPKLNSTIKTAFSKIGIDKTKDNTSVYNLLKRPELKMKDLDSIFNLKLSKDILEQIEISVKYEGYITKAKKEVANLKKLEAIIIPSDYNYDKIHNLASEAKQKLKAIKPRTIGQASRISGVNPADIAVLTIALKKDDNIVTK
ncbi:MAG: tRNA uridine-5-carboxymethylaminomethyl(34) synthesis enzyme MnmG [Bacilli bacterium]